MFAQSTCFTQTTSIKNKNTPCAEVFLFWWHTYCANRAENKQQISELLHNIKTFKEKLF